MRPGRDSGPSERECGPERIPGRARRWSQIPIWDLRADDSNRHSFVNAERIPQRRRPGRDSGPSERECGPERIPGRARRWSQIPIWDLCADDSRRHSFVNAEGIPQRRRPGKDSGPSERECGPEGIPGRASENVARKGFRAERARVWPGRDSGPSERERGPERIPGRAVRLEAHAHAEPWAWHPVGLPYLLIIDWHC